MKLLIVGGAGYVGSIIVPTLEERFDCIHYDLRPVKGFENKTITADVCDEEQVKKAVVGVDSVLYLAMGSNIFNPDSPHKGDVNEINLAFDVNVRGWYKFLYHGLAAGAKSFVYVSSLSVYNRLWDKSKIVDENVPTDSWHPYGLSKRVGEYICDAATQAYPDACITTLRLILPRSEKDWDAVKYDPAKLHNNYATGPNDTRRLFIKAVEFNKPGYHIIQASGDINDEHLPNKVAYELLGWKPNNE